MWAATTAPLIVLDHIEDVVFLRMAVVAVSPAQYQLGTMSNRRAPLTSVPNAVNSPYRVLTAQATKRSRQQLDQEDVGYDQQPPAKKAAVSNGRLALRTPPQKQSLQQVEARVFGKRPGNTQPTSFERRLLEAREKKAVDLQEREHEQRTHRTRNALEGCEGIRQWQKHYRKVFPTFVFYFESVPDETRARHAKFIRAFGAVSGKRTAKTGGKADDICRERRSSFPKKLLMSSPLELCPKAMRSKVQQMLKTQQAPAHSKLIYRGR